MSSSSCRPILFLPPFWLHIALNNGEKKKSARPYLKFGKEKRAPVSSFHSICCYLKKKKKDTPTRAHLSQALVTAPDVHVCTISRLLFLTFYFLIFLVVYIKLYWLPVYLCADKPNKKRTFLFIQPVTYRLLLLTAWPMCLILHITGIDLVKNDSPTT